MPEKLVDETLDPNEYNEQEVKKIIEIALMCTQSPVNLRPTMSEVVVMLLCDHGTDARLLAGLLSLAWIRVHQRTHP